MIAEHDAISPATLRASNDELVNSHEDAAHEKRNWVRLTYDCNNHCLFCLDLLAHNGTMRSNMDIKVQIIEGRKKGANRLILSGGEPTMHPNFLDFVKLGKRAGYPKVQTVTNGRMFAYPEFMEKAADNGLDEITFSLHGHTPELHDGLVATPGAYKEEVAALKAALASGRFIVNIDIVLTKRNVKHLPEMLETFIGWGVKEFDLLHIIPFGAAWGRAKDHLFYDLEGNEDHIRRALEYSRRPDVHIWLNRFPVAHVEGFEELIQDPYKMNDEVRGRREEYDKYLSLGEKLSCRQPERCKYCYMQQLCDGLDDAIGERAKERVDVVRLAKPAPTAGRLPEAAAVHVVAADLAEARELAAQSDAGAVWLELPSYAELGAALDAEGRLFGKALARCHVSTGEELTRVLSLPGAFDVVVALNQSTAPAILAAEAHAARIVVRQPRYDRVTEQRKQDVDVRAVCEQLPAAVRTEDVPPCLGRREPLPPGDRLDAAMLGADARLDMGRYTQRYIADRYTTKSRRCSGCAYADDCRGVHINFIRAHGYKTLEPLTARL